MSVFISALKVKEFLGKEYNKSIEKQDSNITYIYSLDFRPITHLSEFATGYYHTEHTEEMKYMELSYGTYNRFRQAICNMAHNTMPSFIWKLINVMKGKPFVELINFADNEGCFDYKVAEKLYRDFTDYKERAEREIPEFYHCYCTYMEILKDAIKYKGIVEYC